MSGLDHQVLAILEPAVFATDSGATLGPQDQGGPSYTKLASGWADSDRPPARWLNWLFRAAGQFQRATLGGALADWHERTPDALGVDNTGAALVAVPALAGAVGARTLFAFCDSSGAHYYSTDDGINWTAATSLGSYAFYPNNFDITATGKVLWGNDAHVAWKETLNGSFTDVAHNLGADVSAILATHWPSGDSTYLTLAGGTNGVVSTAAGDPPSGFTAASASPADSGSWDSTGIRSFCYLDTDRFLAITQGGQVWHSNDSGDNWTLRATVPGSGNCEFMCRCPHTEAIVATRVSNTAAITAWYSHDDGSSWTACVLAPTSTGGSNAHWRSLKTVGGGAFIGCVTTSTDTSPQWYVTLDRGQNWHQVWPSGTGTGQAKRAWAFGCDGTRVTALWDTASAGNGVSHTPALTTGIPTP